MNLLTVLKPLAKKSQAFLVKNATHLLMAKGTIDSVLALIFAIKAAPDAKEAIDAEKVAVYIREHPDYEGPVPRNWKLSFTGWIKAVARYYGPPAALELMALICFWSAHGIDIRRQAVLSGLCATAEQALREYQLKVKQMLGEKTDKEIRNEIAQDTVDRNPLPASTSYYLDGSTERWFIYRNQRFRSTYQRIKDAQNDANHEMIQHMYISEQEVMWLLDPARQYLKPDSDSGQVGWSVDSMMVFDISWGSDPNHEPVGVVTVYDKDGQRYDPSPGFSRLL